MAKRQEFKGNVRVCSVAMGLMAVALWHPATHAQEQMPNGSVLSFQPENSNVRFEISLKRPLSSTVDNQTVLNGSVLGAVVLQSNSGFAQRIDTYQWTVSPTSRLYLSPSGYKSLVARYQYVEGGESHVLNISCQSRGIRPGKTACKLFGDGPLLSGETKAIGKLSINTSTANDGWFGGASTSGPTASSSSAYRRGYELGLLDAQQNLDRSYGRHRTEYNGGIEESDFRRGYENAYSNISGTGRSGDNTMGGYTGKGSLSLYPTQNKPQEQRYDLTRVVVKIGGNGTGRLSLYTKTTGKTVELQGKLGTTSGGQTLDISAVDGIPAQGRLFIGNNGNLRVMTPILVGSEDQEVSLYFRPN